MVCLLKEVAPACVYLPPCEAWGMAQAEDKIQPYHQYFTNIHPLNHD